jgi:hypothetical protein
MSEPIKDLAGRLIAPPQKWPLELRCLADGCGETRMLDIDRSPDGEMLRVYCRVCAITSFFQEPRHCPRCGGVGSHTDTCSKATSGYGWGV